MGAFACGANKAFTKKNIKFDIISGTSIGAINGAILAGSRSNNPEKDLEDFWLELAESSIKIIPDFFTLNYDIENKVPRLVVSPSASLNAAFFGVPKFFVPRWLEWNWGGSLDRNKNQIPQNWTYLYDNKPLAKTIEKYVDFTKLSPQTRFADADNNPDTIRLIVTAVDVLTSEPLVFDSAKLQLNVKHLLASAGYPQYGFPWTQVGNNTFGWDGALLSNSPVREVLNASPRIDKHIFMVENYPRKITRLPANMTEVQSRAKDIMFSDKTSSLIKLSKLITKHVELIELLYAALNKCEHSHIPEEEIAKIEKGYGLLVKKFGAKILSVIRIVRQSPKSPYSQQNADFSLDTIKNIIDEGEANALQELGSHKISSLTNQ